MLIEWCGTNIGGANLFFLFICFMIFAVFISKFKTGNFINITTPFVLMWLVMLFISHYMYGDLYPVSDKTYNTIYLFVILVMFWFIIFSKKNYKERDNFLQNDIQKQDYFGEKNSKIGHQLLLTIQIIVLVILVVYLIKYNTIKNFIPIDQLRIVRYYVGPLFSSGLELLIYNYFISTFVELMGLIAIVKVIMNFKVDIKTILSLVSLIFFSLIGLGRFGLFNLIYFIVATFLFMRVSFFQYGLSKKKGKKIIFIIGILGMMIIMMVLISSIRQGKPILSASDFFMMLSDSFDQAIIYFIGPFRSLDYFLNYSTNYFEGWLYGKAFFSGLDEFFSFLFSIFGMHWTTGSSVISLLTTEPIYIGQSSTFNAFYTGIFNAYLDGGYYGIVILSSVLGSISGVIWNFHLRMKNFYSFLLIIYFSLILVSTVYRFEFQQFKSYVIIFVLFILSINLKTKNNI